MRTYTYYAPDIYHYGVKGMKWGVRRKAKRDAKEYARAKMYYGEGAGNRRKLIKAKVNERSKDPDYKKEFDRQLSKQNMAKHASAAKRERKVRDAGAATARTTRGLINASLGNIGRASAAAAGIYMLAHATGVDEMVSRYASRKVSDLVNNVRGARRSREMIDEMLRNARR